MAFSHFKEITGTVKLLSMIHYLILILLALSSVIIRNYFCLFLSNQQINVNVTSLIQVFEKRKSPKEP